MPPPQTALPSLTLEVVSMFRLKKIVLAFGLFALTAGLVELSAVSADEPQPKGKKGFDKKKPDEPKATIPGDGKTIIIQIDASKLPPDVLKKLLELGTSSAKPEPGKKPAPVTVPAITLTEAIAIAEKANKGAAATKAERKDSKGAQPVPSFKIDLTDPKGNKIKVTLDASGKVTEIEKKDEDEKKPEPKKK